MNTFKQVCILAALLLTTNAWSQQDGDPVRAGEEVALTATRMAKHGLNLYTEKEEYELGRGLAEEVRKEVHISDNLQLNDYVNTVTQRIVRSSGIATPIVVAVIESDEVNAFTLPGGFLFVNTGLLAACQDEAQLASVIAHEIGHVAARDATKQLSKHELLSLAQIPLAFFGGPIAMAVSAGSQLAVPATMLKFSRDAERDADRAGMLYTYAAGYDPSSFVSFFETLAKSETKQRKISRLFQTHPPSEERARMVQAVIQTMPEKLQYIQTTNEFTEMKDQLKQMDLVAASDGHLRIKKAQPQTASASLSSNAPVVSVTESKNSFHDMRADFDAMLHN